MAECALQRSRRRRRAAVALDHAGTSGRALRDAAGECRAHDDAVVDFVTIDTIKLCIVWPNGEGVNLGSNHNLHMSRRLSGDGDAHVWCGASAHSSSRLRTLFVLSILVRDDPHHHVIARPHHPHQASTGTSRVSGYETRHRLARHACQSTTPTNDLSRRLLASSF